MYGIRVSLLIGSGVGHHQRGHRRRHRRLAGVKGGRFDDIMMRVTDIFLAFPILVSLLVTRNVLGAVPWLSRSSASSAPSASSSSCSPIFGWMGVARVVRAQVLAHEGARVHRGISGDRRRRTSTSSCATCCPTRSARSWSRSACRWSARSSPSRRCRCSATAPTWAPGPTSLGLLVGRSAKAARAGYWWLVVFPFVALLIITLCISFIGDGLRDATDPKASGGRA